MNRSVNVLNLDCEIRFTFFVCRLEVSMYAT